ncbi:helix-turn-helix domain-containing protein [Anaerobacillus sp. MEB173]|uniref:helix-turn-helix domain-containing protein n=1 Tax=Anaerobacillus sp. MEB173 TaxID=3383345 RepID=UPI003F9371D9
MSTVTGKRLSELRERKGWTKSHVAKLLHIKTVSTYANWEYGLRQPDNETIVKIAELYDVSTDYLLGRSDKPNYEESDKNDGLAFLGGGEDITEEEEEYLKESLELFRKMKAKANKNKD